MKTSRPTPRSQRWGFTLIGFASLLVAMVGGSGIAEASNRMTWSASAQTASKLRLSVKQVESPDATRPSWDGRAAEPVARRPRVWKMPVAVALRDTRSLARYLYEETSPNDFDDSGRIIGPSTWDFYNAGLCERKSKSRVNCTGLIEADFETVDDQDQPVGEDTFYCVWEQTVWYPRAKNRKLKSTVVSEYCGWESDD